MKVIRVVAAVITSFDLSGEKIVFATKRGYGEYKGGWEFPGGKIELDESPEEALKREILEELDTQIKVGDFITTVEYDYPSFHLSMDCYFAEVIEGDLVLKEAMDSCWLRKDNIDKVGWLPADLELIETIKGLI